jgi:hypothetical protein
MMRLLLPPKSTEAIEEKLLKTQEHKIRRKYSENHRKGKTSYTLRDKIQSQKSTILMKIKRLQDVKTAQTSSHFLKNLEDLSFISSLL